MADWKLGKDMIPSDTILDPVTFDDLILALKCNCERITPDAVIIQATEIVNQRLEDWKYLIENNIDEIMRWQQMNRLKTLVTMISHSKNNK